MRRRIVVGGAVALALALALGATVAVSRCGRKGAKSADQMRQEIAALEQEIPALKEQLNDLVASDTRLVGMPKSGVRVGVPTALARTMIERVITGFVDSVTLRLSNLKVHKAGRIKKVVSIGEYELDVAIVDVMGQLKTGKPRVDFGGNKLALALPVEVASGSGEALIHFKWDGKNVSGAVCGDMEIDQKVSGNVKPSKYPISGALELTATTRQILASPKLPPVKVNLKVDPSAESWAAVQQILDSKGGVCGFVLDKVDIKGVLEGLLEKGFDVRLPTEKIKPIAVPVGISPTMTVRGKAVNVGVKVSELAITEHMIWLGADVTVGGPGDDSVSPVQQKGTTK